jgi:hypothetical protein
VKTTAWTRDELDTIARTNEMRVAPLHSDGTPRNPTTIWVVRDGDELYVRAANGPGAVWYRAAKATRQGHISVGGIDKDVTFADESDEVVNDRIDSGYLSKYGGFPSQVVDPMVAPDARAATLRLIPRAS